MPRYFVLLAFDGTPYHGWQVQHNAPAVQKRLNEAFSLLLRQQVRLTGCGRTDTGVHAEFYAAHFDLDRSMSPSALQHLEFRMNSYLEKEIVIYRVLEVPQGMHARFSALSRTYEYRITMRKNPFLVNFSHYLYGDIDIDRMNEGAKYLCTINDFTSFSKVDTDTKTNLCNVTCAAWKRSGDTLIFTITANRFLRNMVRAIVGTLLDLGKGKITLEELKQITESKDRCEAGDSVPACGLFLTHVDYPGLPGL